MSFIMHTKIKKKFCNPPSLLCSHSQKSIFEINQYESDLSAEHETILNHLSFHTPTAWDRTLIFESFSLTGRMEIEDILMDIL